MSVVGFEVWVQGFADGEAADLHGSIVRQILAGLGADADVSEPTSPRWSVTVRRPSLNDLAMVARLVSEVDAVAYWPAHVPTPVVAHPDKAADLPPHVFKRHVAVQTAEDIERANRSSDDRRSTIASTIRSPDGVGPRSSTDGD